MDFNQLAYLIKLTKKNNIFNEYKTMVFNQMGHLMLLNM